MEQIRNSLSLFWSNPSRNIFSSSFAQSYNIGSYSEGQVIEIFAKVFDTSGNRYAYIDANNTGDIELTSRGINLVEGMFSKVEAKKK